jgi:hypothetical protein
VAQRAVLIEGGVAAAAPQGMIAGRFLAGIGIGLSSALVPLYISEVAARFFALKAITEGLPASPTQLISTQRRCLMAYWL